MKKFPLLFKTFISLVIFFLITIFIIFAIFNYGIINYSQNEIGKSSIGKLKIIRNINELIMDSINKDALKLSSNSNMYNLNDLKLNSDENKVIFEIRDILDTFDSIIRINDFIYSIYLYVEDSGIVISSRSGMEYIDNFSDNEWLQSYNENKKNGLRAYLLKTRIPTNKLENNKTNSLEQNKVMTYILPLSAYTSNTKGTILINIYEDKLSRLVNNNDINREGYIFIINSEGDVISHIDKQLVGKNISDRSYISQILSSKNSEGYMNANVNGDNDLVTYFKSDFNDCTYVGVFSLNTLRSNVNDLRMNLIYVLIVLVPVGIFVSYLISRRLYNPMRKLMQEICAQKGLSFSGDENEVTTIQKVFNTIIKREDYLFNILEKNKRHVRDKQINALLNGNIGEVSEPKLLEELFPYEHFICCYVAIDRYVEFSKKFDDQQKYYLKTMVLSFCQEILNNGFKCEGVLLEKQWIGIIINTDIQDYRKNSQYLRDGLKNAQKELKKIMDFSITVAIGSLCSELKEIPNSFSEARELFKLRLIKGHGSILSIKDNEVTNEKKYCYPFNAEKHILNKLSIGSKDGVLTTVGEFIDDIKTNKELTYDNIILILNQMLGSTVKYLMDNNLSVSEIFGSEFNIYGQLFDNETLDDIGIWLIRVYLDIIKYSGSIKSGDKNYVDEALEYIHQNFKSDIDINVLADKLGISYSQLRRAFLEKTGENIINYINIMRIEEAKRLLRQTNDTIPDIAISLGYNNNQSFNRFFKKYEGITPGEFRKAIPNG